MIFAAIDPGLDVIAAALFDTSKWEPSHQFDRAAKAYTGYTTWETSATDLLPTRLHRIFETGELLAKIDHVELAYVEQPSTFGAYGRNRGKGGNVIPQGMAKFWQALGALLAGLEAAGVRIVMVPAPKIPKPKRHQAVRAVLGKAFGMGPRGGDRRDVLDATFLGMWALTEPGLRPRP